MPYNITGQPSRIKPCASLADVITEEFLWQPMAVWRERLAVATGDKRFRSMPGPDVERFIENTINELGREERARVAGNRLERPRALTEQQRLWQIANRIADRDDEQLFNRFLRSMKEGTTFSQRWDLPADDYADERAGSYQEHTASDAIEPEPVSHGMGALEARLDRGNRVPSPDYYPRGESDRGWKMMTVDREGALHNMPYAQLPEAMNVGHAVVMPMTSPTGKHGYVPVHVTDVAQQRGFTLGHKVAEDPNNAPWYKRLENWAGDLVQSGMQKAEGFADDEAKSGINLNMLQSSPDVAPASANDSVSTPNQNVQNAARARGSVGSKRTTQTSGATSQASQPAYSIYDSNGFLPQYGNPDGAPVSFYSATKNSIDNLLKVLSPELSTVSGTGIGHGKQTDDGLQLPLSQAELEEIQRLTSRMQQAAANPQNNTQQPMDTIEPRPNTFRNWLGDIEGDVRYLGGSGVTLPGRIMRSLGYQGFEPMSHVATNSNAGEMIGGVFLGPVEVAEGNVDFYTGHPIAGTNEALRGLGHTLALPIAATNPEFLAGAATFGVGQNLLQRGLEYTGLPKHYAEFWSNLAGLGVGIGLHQGVGRRTPVESQTPVDLSNHIRNQSGLDGTTTLFGDRGYVSVPRIGSYATLSKILQRTGMQADHLNVAAIYGDKTPYSQGLTTPMTGSPFGAANIGKLHYEAHWSLENFFDLYRSDGPFSNERPTNDQFIAARKQSFINAGLTKNEAEFLAKKMKEEQTQAGLIGSDPIPISKMYKKWMYQKKP